MDKTQIILDYSMRGFEGGGARIYKKYSPTIMGRMYKEPLKVLEIQEIDKQEETEIGSKHENRKS